MSGEVLSGMENFSATRRERFGRLLRLAREVAGLHPRAVAGELGLTAQAVRNWEHDVRTPPRESLAAVEKLLGVTPGRLVSIVYDDVPCPIAVPVEEAIEGFGLGPRPLAALRMVVDVFLDDRPPYVEAWILVEAKGVAMTPSESIQEDPRLTFGEKLRVLDLIGDFVTDREGSAATSP